MSPFDGIGGGLYWIAAVKKMTSKKDFLAMDCMDNSCVADVSEECKAKSLLVECNCVPWEMPGFEVEFCQKEKNLNHFVAGNQQVH